jgi:hypothetical protein
MGGAERSTFGLSKSKSKEDHWGSKNSPLLQISPPTTGFGPAHKTTPRSRWRAGKGPASRVQVPGLFDFDSDSDFDLDKDRYCESLKGHRHAKDQLMRASQAIPLNIAERNGNGKDGDQGKMDKKSLLQFSSYIFPG